MKSYNDARPITPELLLGWGHCKDREGRPWYELGADYPSITYTPHQKVWCQWVYRDVDGDPALVRPPQTMGELFRLCDSLGAEDWPIIPDDLEHDKESTQ